MLYLSLEVRLFADIPPRLHFDEVAISILRPVHPKKLFIEESTAHDLRIMHCQHIIEIVEDHFRTYLPGDYTTMFLHGCLHTCLALISTLDDPICQDFFTKAAALLRRGVVDIPGMQLVLSVVETIVWALEKNIPSAAKASFRGQTVSDILTEWAFAPGADV